MAEKSGRGWQALMDRSRDKVEELRADMAQVGQYVGLDISEFRRIVNQVQKGEKEARQAKKGNGRGEPASRDLDRQENTRTAACNSSILYKKATSG